MILRINQTSVFVILQNNFQVIGHSKKNQLFTLKSLKLTLQNRLKHVTVTIYPGPQI